ncbi:hypothetical protein [Tenacibaculum retecalamus]|uniref:hypothetical protein n=1 Tax=Tenacibaculum retecalamus TaxID=3018315 RepID=UPI0023D92925|nr:hypothetical protein [Tenacibaculum retecalamus]WBX70218.1 hypothetical protein PG912_07920 [Tenacibaculum retecalamus]
MNKKEITGLVLIFIGMIMQLILKNEIIDFISGLLIGIGIGFLFASKIKNNPISFNG